MNDRKPHSNQEIHLAPERHHLGFWAKLGGGALTFAILIHLIVLLIGAIWIFQVIREPEPIVDFIPSGGGGGDRSASTKVNTKKRAQITPTTNVKRVFVEGSTSSYSIPDPGENFGAMATLTSLSTGGMTGGMGGSGSGNGFGKGFGSGMGTGRGMSKLFGLIPETMGKRCSKDDRLQRLTENGGTPACEDAVMNGLRWLKANQKPNGSWGDAHSTAMTGLALLAYFGHCETTASEEFGDSCLKAIVYLVDLGMKNNGKIGTNFSAQPFCYEHAIATYALAEATTFSKDLKHTVPNLKEVTEKAGQFIIDNQADQGAWAYGYKKSGGDVSVAGWQIQALKACSHTGLKYRNMIPCINKGLAYLATCQNDNGGFGYNGKNPVGGLNYWSLTGVGMLCHQMWGKGTSEVRMGAKYIIKNTRFEYTGEYCDLYAHYYESQAMIQRGG
ncbi:MAG: hypothetical protein RLZZ282_215, partial [Verrucomicrobiota bacterium]